MDVVVPEPVVAVDVEEVADMEEVVGSGVEVTIHGRGLVGCERAWGWLRRVGGGWRRGLERTKGNRESPTLPPTR